MRDIDLGITRALGPEGETRIIHVPDLTAWEKRLVEALGEHARMNPAAYFPAGDLAQAVELDRYNGRSRSLAQAKRDLRILVTHLVEKHDLPLIAWPGVRGGYRLADDRSQIEEAVATHLARVRSGVRKVRALQGAGEALAAELVQLTLDLPKAASVEVHRSLGERLGGRAAAPSLAQVRRALAIYRGDPARYAREIEDLRREFEGMFVRAEDLQAVRLTLAQAQEALDRALGAGGGGQEAA